MTMAGAALEPLFFDNFNRSDRSLHLDYAVTGQQWNATQGAASIVGNAAATVGLAGDNLCLVNVGESDIDIMWDFYLAASSTRNVSVTFRGTVDAANTRWGFYINPTEAALWRSYSPQAQAESTYSTDRTYAMRVRCVGSTIECYVDGALVISHTSSTYQTSTAVGMYCYLASGARTIDNLTVELP